jgi:hypothetical protein
VGNGVQEGPWTKAGVVVAIVGTIAGILAVIVTIVLANTGSSTGSAAASTRPQPSAVASKSTSEPAPPRQEAGAATVYHEGTLVLADNSVADLDAPPADKQWRKGTPGHPYDYDDLDWISYRLTSYNVGPQGIISMGATTDSSYETCANTSGYAQVRPVPANDLKVGNLICAITSEGRFATLVIQSLQLDQGWSSRGTITLSVVVYDK